LLGKLTFYGKLVKSIACVLFMCKAVDKIRIKCFQILVSVNELVVTSNKLKDNFSGLLASWLDQKFPTGHQLNHCVFSSLVKCWYIEVFWVVIT
jgi:hypothetical protein